MPIKPEGKLGRLFHIGVLARWKEATTALPEAPRSALRAQRHQAQQLKSVLQKFCDQADDRLALPPVGSTNFVRPIGTDWSWRPPLWRQRNVQPGYAPVPDKTRFGDDIRFFHDCQNAEISVRQVRNLEETDIAAFSLTLDVFHFAGTYLSVVIDLPPEACVNVKKQHLIQLSTAIETERPITIFARLNIKCGPNTEQIVMTLPDTDCTAVVEFDLAYTQLNEKRVEKMWLDLIINDPHMNRVRLRDLTMARYPRAQI